MSLALQRLKNIGWMALVCLVAILLYPLSLNVAALHSDLVRVDNSILNTKREISFLQAELRTRASLAQLEEWNDMLYGYQPPSAQQFINGEAALAGLGGRMPTVKPVMVAVSDADGVAPAGVVGNSPYAPMESTAKRDEGSKQIAMAEQKKIPDKLAIKSRTERLADMDAKLLSDHVMRDIGKRAENERKGQ